jgi:O-antigen/teichoic acid export membrane protein
MSEGSLENPEVEAKASPTEPEPSLGERAGKGVSVVFGRGLLVKALGLLSTLFAARILSTADFGALAIGLTFSAVASTLADGGLGAGLIRRADDPTRAELRSVLGIQLVLTIGMASLVSAAGLPFGQTGAVTAAMVWLVPALALRTPATIIAERNLDYSPLARADIAAAVVTSLVAIGTLLAGAGIWGVAGAYVLGSWVGGVLTMFSVPGGRVRPSFRVAPIRSVLAFGARFQAVQLVNMARDQGLNLGLAAFGGTAVLGIWSLAGRILQLPMLLLASLWRVSYPAMSIRVAEDGDLTSAVDSLVTNSSVALGLILAPIGAASIFGVPLVFGAKWTETGQILAPICAFLAITGPISVGCAALLTATANVRAVLWLSAVCAAVWLAITLPLIGPVGIMAIPIGWACSSLLEGALFSIVTRRLVDTWPFWEALKASAPALVGGSLGLLAGNAFSADALATAVAASVAVASTWLLSKVLQPEQLTSVTGRVLAALPGGR